MKEYEKIKMLVAAIEEDVIKFSEKGNAAVIVPLSGVATMSARTSSSEASLVPANPKTENTPAFLVGKTILNAPSW